MTTRLYLLGIGLLMLLQGCGVTSSNETIISGEVLTEANSTGIQGATVEITSPSEFARSTTTNENGIFSFALDINEDEPAEITIRASKAGYTANQLAPFTVTSGNDVNDLIISLSSQNTSGGGGGGTQEQVGGDPEGAAAILLTGVSNQSINIAETGDVVSSAFSFVVQDSAGRALNSAGAVTVKFNIISGPGGGEDIIPDTARTNSQGRVTTSLFSGNAAGPVKIEALVERPEVGLTIRSKPVLIAIHGGFPDANHFSIGVENFNFEGYNINGVRDRITVIVGDKFSNPVKPGTVVYFSTSGGVIQGSGETNSDGFVSVDVISGDPRPNDAISGSGGRPGYATITASTVDENDVVITKQTNVLFSGIPQPPVISPSTFAIPANGGESFTYTVTDQNGNPLAPGTQFTVEVGEGLDATGDVDFALGDYMFPGPGTTDFAFSVTDTDEQASDVGGTSITVRVVTPSGKQASTTIQGTRAKGF